MNDPRIDDIYITQFAFAAVHLLYFMIYYGRYSTLNQKLSGIAKMEKAEIVEQEVIDASRVSINSKIRKLRKWSYYPIPAIALIHFVVLYSLVPTKDYLIEIDPYFYADYYFHFGYITIGSFLMILVGNFVKGAQIFDPNKRFWGGMGRRW